MLPPVNTGVLAKDLFAQRIPRAENDRTHYGKLLDLMRIDYALRAAERGRMMMLTDISREQLTYDGHLSAILQKRLNRLAALDWDVVPASGDNINPGKAEFYAAYVRAQLEGIPRFRDALNDLAWAVYDGRAASELDWRFLDGEWVLLGLNWIHPRRLSYGPHRDIRVIDTRHDEGNFRDQGFPIQQVPYKFVVYTPRLFNDYPEREGLAVRTLYWSYFGRCAVREENLLQEVFGRPWRVIEQLENNLAALNPESEKIARESIERLGFNNVAQLPAGWKLNVINPPAGAGQVSVGIRDHAEKVQSKLVLGSTGTTDAVSTGLGSSIGDAHLSEEDLIIASDARREGETVEDGVTDAIIAVNFGPAEVSHAPRFIFRTDPPMSREAELGRIKGALELGLRVSVEEAQEKLGIQEVRDGEPYLVRVQRTPELGQPMPPPAPEVVYPVGKAPPPGEVVAQPDEALNLPAGGGGLPPATPPAGGLPPGAPPPPQLPPGAPPTGASTQGADVDEPDAVARLAEKMTELQLPACEHGRRNRCDWCGIERERDVEMVNGQPQWVIRWRPIARASAAPLAPSLRASAVDTLLEETRASSSVWLEAEASRLLASSVHGDHVCLAAQPESVFGSPDVMVERGVDEMSAVTGEFAERLAAACRGKSTAADIREALDRAAERFSEKRLAEPIERELLQGSMLGALDADWEAETDRAIEVESFTALHVATITLADTDTRFAARPLADAIQRFLEKEPVTRDVFDQMREAAQRRAFTVANAANDEMLRTVKRELLRQLAVGADLRNFSEAAAARLQSAGWTPANGSHVETIFRTNVLGAYNGGRARQMTQPDVMATRPFWQILGVTDGRQRRAHREAHGLVLAATDPFWAYAFPPFGYNCRCRTRSLSVAQGAPRVREGKTILGLPDAGFTSGMGRLLAA